MMPRNREADFRIFHSVIWQTTTTLVETKEDFILFDPTYFPQEISRIQAELRKRGEKKRKILIFTHSDFDHIVGFSPFAAWETMGQIGMISKGENIVRQILDFDNQYYVRRHEPVLYPRIDQAIAQEDWLELDDERLCLMPTYGHTDDGLAVFFSRRRLAVVGDFLSDVEFPVVGHSASQYLQTLQGIAQKVEMMGIQTLIPGHGRSANSKDEIRERLAQDTDYLAQLVSGVKEGIAAGQSPEELQRSLAGLRYQGKVIAPALQKFHRENIHLLIKETRLC